ncbi:MAG: alanine-synthesizing transaminase [Kiritimatiellia bacterium]|jgi:alanine-synthesizing transaminase
MFTDRTSWNLQTNAISDAVAAAQRSGRALNDLTISNPTQCGFDSSKAWDKLDAMGTNTSYQPDARGLLQAREAVSAYYADVGCDVDPEHIFLTSSTSEAYVWLFRLLVNVGERVAVPAPSYPLLDYLADLSDVKLWRYPLHYDGRWWLDVEALRAGVAEGLRALVSISPNNPTGSVVRREEWQELVQLAHAHSFALISDEVFADYLFDPSALGRQSSAAESEILTFTLSGISKVLALPQMKLSWIVVSGPQDDVEHACKRLEVIADTFLSVNGPIQAALPTCLSERTLIQKDIMQRIQVNYAYLKDVFDVDCLNIDGGWSALVRIPRVIDDVTLCHALLEKDGVLVDPGTLFGFADTSHLVLSLLIPPEQFAEGVTQLTKRVAVTAHP